MSDSKCSEKQGSKLSSEMPTDLSCLSNEEKLILKLQGKCTHEGGWTYLNGYGDTVVYTCNLCGVWQSY